VPADFGDVSQCLGKWSGADIASRQNLPYAFFGAPLDVLPRVADADGSNVTPLKHDPGPDIIEPAWSPDGKRIAYAQDNASPSRTSQIFVMNEDGSRVRQLTRDPDWEYCRHPSWSPDGRQIAFSCTLKAAPCWNPIADTGTPVQPWCVVRLFVISPDGSQEFLKPLTDHYGAKPAFAPE
jgi:Tol biopolymer transport system component